MNSRRDFVSIVILAAAATPALGQAVAPTVGTTNSGKASAASIPDFTVTWVHPSILCRFG
jgi:hypothetical protein